MKTIEGELNAAGIKFAIVAARWNGIFTEQLLEGAIGALIAHGGKRDDITVVRVPGSFEIPVTCRKLAVQKRHDAIIAVGTLIKGETDHYELIAKDLSSGISRVMTDYGIPVTFGVVVANNMEQAMARSGSKMGNKGAEAAVAAIELAQVLKKLE